jgi:hypothetical protein
MIRSRAEIPPEFATHPASNVDLVHVFDQDIDLGQGECLGS